MAKDCLLEEEVFCSFVQKQEVPCLFKTTSLFEEFQLSTFNPKNLAKILGSKLIKFRVGRRHSPNLQWEPLCAKTEASVEDFLQWHEIDDCSNVEERGKLLQEAFGACCKNHFWCYADYMYMKDLLDDHPKFLALLNWDSIGFSGKDGRDTTMWLGSKGAYTPCHYDTYGFNVVIQVSGLKKWILFPPSDSSCLYPTRVPYEESSVFSEVNVTNPDLEKHRRFCDSHPHVVELGPGDILYVPHHWWHYVGNLEMSVSVNLWYEMPCDADNRLRESITRLIIGSCLQNVQNPEIPWINPTEDENSVKSVEDGLKYLNMSLGYLSPATQETKGDMSKGASTAIPKAPLQFSLSFQNVKGVTTMYPLTVQKIGGVYGDNVRASDLPVECRHSILKRRKVNGASPGPVGVACSESNRTDLSYEDFVQCLTHPDVVQTISEVALLRFGHG